VFNAGASVWGLDWCPIHPDDRPHCAYKYYLAVAPFPSRTHSPGVGIKIARPSRACVQLWSFGPSPGTEGSDDDKGEMKCEMVLCIDSGPALELKWCPLPSHDPLSGPSLNSPRKLGLLAGVFEDGSLSVYVVPYPPDLAYADLQYLLQHVAVLRQQMSPSILSLINRDPQTPLATLNQACTNACDNDFRTRELVVGGLRNTAKRLKTAPA